MWRAWHSPPSHTQPLRDVGSKHKKALNELIAAQHSPTILRRKKKVYVITTEVNLAPKAKENIRRAFKERTGEDCIIMDNGLKLQNFPVKEVMPSIRKNSTYPRLAPEVSPAELERLIRIMRRIVLDAGGTAGDVLEVAVSILQTWNVPVPEVLIKPIKRQLSFEEMGLLTI